MSKQENQGQTNQAVEIEDLNVEDAVQQEVTGGEGARMESANNLKQIGLATISLADL
jgi:hypothetical protein